MVLPFKGPFQTRRDLLPHNITAVRAIRLPKGATILHRRQYASAVVETDTAVVNMPYTGTIRITVSDMQSPSEQATLVINNPFITGTDYGKVGLRHPSGSSATISATGPGQATVTLDNPIVAGIYVVSIGKD